MVLGGALATMALEVVRGGPDDDSVSPLPSMVRSQRRLFLGSMSTTTFDEITTHLSLCAPSRHCPTTLAGR
jgi:hypothetical protein